MVKGPLMSIAASILALFCLLGPLFRFRLLPNEPLTGLALTLASGLDELPDFRLRRKSGADDSTAPAKRRCTLEMMQTKPSSTPRDCLFLCGRKDHDKDLVNPDQYMRWSYPRYPNNCTHGNNCWYCERVFVSYYQHVENNRSEFQGRLGRNHALHSEFHSRTEKQIKDRASGTRRLCEDKRPQRLEREEASASKLIRPDCPFWPMEQYKDLHGDPKSAENRKTKGIDWQSSMESVGSKALLTRINHGESGARVVAR